MGKSILSGLPAETRKQILAQIKVGKKLLKQEEEQEYDKYWASLTSLTKQIDGLVDKAKASGSVPKGTTLKRLTMMPKAKPSKMTSRNSTPISYACLVIPKPLKKLWQFFVWQKQLTLK